MLAAVFSFRGRINRLQYFLGNLAVGATLILLAMLYSGFVDLPAKTQPTLGMAIDAVFLVIATPLMLLIGASLQVRRLRDIGCGPALGLIAWAGVIVVAALVTGNAAQSQIAAGTAINFAVLTCLYAWPGKRGGIRSLSGGGWLMVFAPSTALAPVRARAEPLRLGR
jgi:uncharacterized membrane protein YhaH (DUF805 family)